MRAVFAFAAQSALAENAVMPHPHCRATLATAAIAALLAACAGEADGGTTRAAAAVPANAGQLKLATWNLEWLIAPQELRRLRRDCLPDGAFPGRRERFVPCDVATDLERAATDLEALARYSRRLDADVIALQEVDGPAAARLVFEGYEFCFTSRRHVQNTGFAIRRGIPYRCAEYAPLSLDGRVRRGAEVVLYPGESRELHLLSVHLKSGCNRRSLDSGRDACAVLARQVPALERWIDERAARSQSFAVLGDFNRDLLDDRGPARGPSGSLRSLWAELDDGDPPEADLVNPAEGRRFRNCSPDQNHGGYIDHIVLSRSLAQRLVPGSFERLVFLPDEALRLRLADHCPVAVTVALRR
jgi:endonuclease/exonuclease/phosphatase family metal-dependent hydrolase